MSSYNNCRLFACFGFRIECEIEKLIRINNSIVPTLRFKAINLVD